MSDVHDRIAELEAQLAELKAQVGSAPTPEPPADRPMDRRSMLRNAGVAIAGAATGAYVLGAASPAAAADGDTIVAGTRTVASSPTELKMAGGATPRVLLLVNESVFTPAQSAFPATLATWSDGDHYGLYAWGAAKPAIVAATGSVSVAPLQLDTLASPPGSGAHVVGEYAALANGALVVCSVEGTPGTWSNVGFNGLTPTRFLDTRNGTGLVGKQGAGDANVRTLAIAGVTVGGTTVPASARAVAANITVTNPTSGGYITIWNTGVARPDASNVNFLADRTVANFAILPLGSGGAVSLFNFAGDVDILIDVAGYFI
jgi:hypothetical protein